MPFEKNEKRRTQVLEAIRKNPNISAWRLAEKLKTSKATAQHYLVSMEYEGIIKQGQKWIVVEDNRNKN